MGFNASRRIERTIKETREWLAEGAPVLEEMFGFLDEDLGKGTLKGLGRAAITLEVMAVYYGRKGMIRVLDGDRAGWEEIQKGVAYHFWRLKIRAQRFFKTALLQPTLAVKSLDLEVASTGCLFCYYLASGSEVGQRYTIDVLKGIATVPGAVNERYWETRIFEPFVLRLNQKQETFELPDSLEQRDLGRYAKVLEHWNDPDRLAEVIFGLCDYHCRNMEDFGGDWRPEFDDPPFNLVPCEIVAIYALRGKLGLVTPRVEHPLLLTPLSEIPRETEPYVDDILARVQRVYSQIFE